EGEPIEVTQDPRAKYNLAFSPDGSRIAYTVWSEDHWYTYTVSTRGGKPELFLQNAAGLTWLDEKQLLFSRVKAGVQMGILTGALDKGDLREIYLPANERGMAHCAYSSPDLKWALVEEMDPEWKPCRLIPMTGGSLGSQVGPPGGCTSAAWSPDGAW